MHKNNKGNAHASPACKTRKIVFTSGDKVTLSTRTMDISNTVLNVLENMNKLPARDIAGRSGLSCEDTIDILLDLERIGIVHQLNGYWMLAPVPKTVIRNVPAKYRRTRVRRNERVAE